MDPDEDSLSSPSARTVDESISRLSSRDAKTPPAFNATPSQQATTHLASGTNPSRQATNGITSKIKTSCKTVTIEGDDQVENLHSKYHQEEGSMYLWFATLEDLKCTLFFSKARLKPNNVKEYTGVL